MASEQVKQIIDVENTAARYELDAQRKADEILDHAKFDAESTVKLRQIDAEAKAKEITSAAIESSNLFLKEEERCSSSFILAQREIASINKPKAIDAAISLLIERS